jgi:DNA-binding NtrC family response regulator
VAEIRPLARKFIAEAAESVGIAPPALSSAATAMLHAHAWPGNVRELREVVTRAVSLCKGRAILPEHLFK